jgi:hypothetical protein
MRGIKAGMADYTPVPNVSCSTCQQFLEEMNAASLKVHEFIVLRWENRALDDEYLHELGELIQAQAKAHQELVLHQNSHSMAA